MSQLTPTAKRSITRAAANILRSARRGFGRSPQQVDIAHSVNDRPLAHLSDETLQLLVEYGQQLEDGSGVVVDGGGQVVTE